MMALCLTISHARSVVLHFIAHSFVISFLNFYQCMRNSPQLYWNTGEDDRDLICCQEQSTQQCGMLPENV